VADETIKITAETSAASDALRDNARAVDEVNTSLQKNEDASNKSAGATAAFAAKLAVAAAAVGALTGAIGDAVDAYANLDAEQGRIIRNLGQMGFTADESAAALDKLNAQFLKNTKYGVGIQEQTELFRQQLDVTKDLALAQEDLALAVDIQADGVTDLKGAMDALTKVRNGDTGALKKLNAATKDQLKDLGKITDESLRAEVAMRILRKEFDGAADANLGLADNMAEVDEKMKAVEIAAGKVAGQVLKGSLGLIDALVLTNEELESGITFLDKFANALTNLADDASRASENMGHFFSEFSTQDAINFFTGGKSFTEQVQTIAGRGKAREAGGLTGFARYKKNFGGSAVGEEDTGLGTDDLIGLAGTPDQGPGLDGSRGGPAKPKPGPSKPEAWKASAEQIEQHAKNHNEAMVKLQQEQEEALAEMIEEGRKAREAQRLKEYDAETAAMKAKKDAEVAAQKEIADARKAERAAREADLQAGAEIAVQGAISFIENEQAKAAISALLEGARAVAAGAAGNIPGAIAHGVASAQFAVVAAKSIMAGVQGKQVSPAGGGAASGAASQDTARTGAVGADAAQPQQSGGPTVVNINYRSVSRPTNEEAQAMGEAVARHSRNQVGG
jgi:hypothetical protein